MTTSQPPNTSGYLLNVRSIHSIFKAHKLLITHRKTVSRSAKPTVMRP